MKLYIFAVGEGMFFCEEGGSEGGFVVVIEFLIGETCEDGGFSDS